MKIIIGILGVAMIAATMFFSANNVNVSSSDASLASLMGMNTANAETSYIVCHLVSRDLCGIINNSTWVIGYGVYL